MPLKGVATEHAFFFSFFFSPLLLPEDWSNVSCWQFRGQPCKGNDVVTIKASLSICLLINRSSNLNVGFVEAIYYGLVTVHPRVRQGLRPQWQSRTSKTALRELLSPQVRLNYGLYQLIRQVECFAFCRQCNCKCPPSTFASGRYNE